MTGTWTDLRNCVNGLVGAGLTLARTRHGGALPEAPKGKESGVSGAKGQAGGWTADLACAGLVNQRKQDGMPMANFLEVVASVMEKYGLKRPLAPSGLLQPPAGNHRRLPD